MNLDIETLFPDGLSDETISAISEVLNEIALQWESSHFDRIRRHHSQHQDDLFEQEQPWKKRPTDKWTHCPVLR
jgi:hypothetical protein